jgi:DNA-binding NarL/FixJ family response regulator
MDLIIVDENIKYGKSLREYCIKSSDFKNVIVFRSLKELLETYVPKKGILLFELSNSNKELVKSLEQKNNNIILVGLTNEKQIRLEDKSTLENVSSLISKSETLDEILEQLVLIIKGKSIIPQKIFETIKSSSKEKRTTTAKQKINSVITKLFL